MIEVEDQGAIRTLRLARPPVNALNRELIRSLEAAVVAAPREGARGLIITGANGRFCAGLDVQELLSLDEPGLADFLAGFFGCLTRVAASPIPVVAAINGHAPAGGAVLSLFCDRRILAAGEYRIGLNEVQVGLFPGATIHAVLARIVGARVAADILPAGTLLEASAALAVGLVDELAPIEAVGSQARAWLTRMLALPREAYALTRQLVRADLIALMQGHGAGELAAASRQWRSPETLATLRALVERLGRR